MTDGTGGVFSGLPAPGPRCAHAPVEWLVADDLVGLPVPVQAVLARSPSLLVIARRFVAYRTGVAFTVDVEINAREPRGVEIPVPRLGSGDRRRCLAVGVVDAGGGRASTVSPPGLSDDPSGPVLTAPGGGGTAGPGGSFSLNCWLWPLPPPGPLRIVVAWLDAGLDEVWGEVDGSALREAGVASPGPLAALVGPAPS